MTRTRSLMKGAAAAALALGLSLGAGAAAYAAPTTSSSTAVQTIDVTFSLLVPNAPVTFTVDGATVGAGTTDSTGNVAFSYTPDQLAPGYYRLVATTSYGISSSIGFQVG